MKELTFREVIANIKEGEVWKCTRDTSRVKEIRMEMSLGTQTIRFDCGDDLYNSYAIEENDTFKLQRKEYTFEEAFKAYEEGKEIESVFSNERYRLVDGIDEIYAPEDGEWEINSYGLDLREVRGKWYINNL